MTAPREPVRPAFVTTTTALLHGLRETADGPVWEVLVERYEPVLVGVGRRLGLREADARDVAQQTLLEFVRDFRAGRYDRDRGRLRSWAISIAGNRARDALRRAAVRSAAPLDEDATLAPDRLDAAWDESQRAHVAAAAWREVQASGDFTRPTLDAFELTAVRGVPAGAVAERLGLSVDAVYAARHRVARRVRAAVDRIEATYEADAP